MLITLLLKFLCDSSCYHWPKHLCFIPLAIGMDSCLLLHHFRSDVERQSIMNISLYILTFTFDIQIDSTIAFFIFGSHLFSLSFFLFCFSVKCFYKETCLSCHIRKSNGSFINSILWLEIMPRCQLYIFCIKCASSQLPTCHPLP